MRNEKTGVYFLIDFDEPNIEKEDIEVFDCFDDFENLNTSASINFFRPDYFGNEIFPIIANFSEKLDLYILNLGKSLMNQDIDLKMVGKRINQSLDRSQFNCKRKSTVNSRPEVHGKR